MSSKELSAFSVESALVALESLMKSDAPSRPTSSMRCGRPGKAAQRRLDRPAAPTPHSRATATAAAAFWALWSPRSEPMPGEVGDLDARGRRGRRRSRPRARRRRPARAERPTGTTPAAGPARARRHGAARLVVDADHREVGRGHQPLLDGRIGSMVPWRSRWSGEMLSSTPIAGRERRREVDLEGRALDHVDAVGGGRLERQDRGADIAAHLHVAAGLRAGYGRSAPSWSTCRWCR